MPARVRNTTFSSRGFFGGVSAGADGSMFRDPVATSILTLRFSSDATMMRTAIDTETITAYRNGFFKTA